MRIRAVVTSEFDFGGLPLVTVEMNRTSQRLGGVLSLAQVFSIRVLRPRIGPRPQESHSTTARYAPAVSTAVLRRLLQHHVVTTPCTALLELQLPHSVRIYMDSALNFVSAKVQLPVFSSEGTRASDSLDMFYSQFEIDHSSYLAFFAFLSCLSTSSRQVSEFQTPAHVVCVSLPVCPSLYVPLPTLRVLRPFLAISYAPTGTQSARGSTR